MSEDVKINILGTCVIRDTFREQGDRGCSIKRFVQSVSPYAAVTGGGVVANEDELERQIAEGKTSNFNKRNLLLDINKKAFDFVREEQADWLLIDMACCRYDLYYFREQDAYTSKTGVLDEIYSSDVLAEHELIDTDTIADDILYALLDRYIEKLKETQSPDKMVLFEIKAGDMMLNKDGKISNFDIERAKRYNRRMDKAFRYVRGRLDGCHVIEFPDEVLLDEGHIWGKANLHYTKDYYQYAYEAFQIIMQCKNPADERVFLDALRQEHERKMREKYKPNWTRTLADRADKGSRLERMYKYLGYFKIVLLNEERCKNLLGNFESGKITHCAFYGASEICRWMVDLIQQRFPAVTVDFIVENTAEKTYKGVPFIKRTAESYPATGLMIIADVMSKDAVYGKLSEMNYTSSVTDVYKLTERLIFD